VACYGGGPRLSDVGRSPLGILRSWRPKATASVVTARSSRADASSFVALDNQAATSAQSFAATETTISAKAVSTPSGLDPSAGGVGCR
jgi:hypothetical protein